MPKVKKDRQIIINNLVVKSNALIRGSYDLTTNEQKIIYALAAQIRPEDSDFREYTFSIKDFYELLDLSSKGRYKELRETVEKLAATNFTFREGNDIVTVAWLTGVRYHEGEGLITLTFHQWLRPYLLQLKSYFTSLNTSCIYHLAGKHSIRLFEYLKSYSYTGKDIYIDLQELKEFLFIENKYKAFTDFRVNVLDKAQKEFQEHADIIFTFSSVRANRKIVGINFHIEPNPNFDKEKQEIKNIVAIKNAPCSQDMCLIRLKEFGVNEKVAKDLLKLRSGTTINLILNRVQAEYEAEKVKDLAAFTVAAIKGGYYEDNKLEAQHKKKQQEQLNMFKTMYEEVDKRTDEERNSYTYMAELNPKLQKSIDNMISSSQKKNNK